MLPAELKVRVPATRVRHHYIHLAHDEYRGTVDMRAIATAHLREHGPTDPSCALAVTVHEHGGWYETYVQLTLDGETRVGCIRSANDRAEYPKEVEAVQMIFKALPLKVEARTHWRRRPAAGGGGYYPANG